MAVFFESKSLNCFLIANSLTSEILVAQGGGN